MIDQQQAWESMTQRSSFWANVEDLKPHPRYREVTVPLPAEAYQRLRDSIDRYGIRVPLHILKDGTILDGFHRWMVAKELAMDRVPVMVLPFRLEIDQLIWMIRANLDRRQLSVSQRAMLAKRLYELEKEKAKERMEATQAKPGEQVGLGPGKLSLALGEKGQARDLAAKQVGISGRTLEKAMKAIEQHPQLEEKLRRGEISVDQAYRLAKAQAQAQDNGHRQVTVTSEDQQQEDDRRLAPDMTRTCFLLTKEEYHKIQAVAHSRLMPLPKFLRILVQQYLEHEAQTHQP